MNKSEFVNKYAQAMRVSKAEAERHVRCFVELVKDALCRGESVNFTGFGQFKVKKRPSRQVRNPQTGQLMQVPEKIVPNFSAGKELKQSVNQ